MVQVVQFDEAASIWREDSPVWAIVAGELLLQGDQPIAQNKTAMIELGASRAEVAAASLDTGDLNAAGHSLIGCALALALGARPDESTTLAAYASELADALSWQVSKPTAPELIRMADEIRAHVNGEDTATRGSTLWELALKVGGMAVGLSPQIDRRRERRDLISQSE
jgi:hypothetical protein